MNRSQRRKIEKKIKRMDEKSQKINIFRALLTMNDNELLLSLRSVNPVVANSLVKFIMPKSLKTISVAPQAINDQMNFNDSILWTLMICKDYSIYIEKYLEYRSEYEKKLLTGEYLLAKSIINQIISECGMSIWACGQLLILEECIDGLEGNKKLLGEFLDCAKGNTLVSTLLEFLSYKAEVNTSLNNYNEKTDRFIKLFDEDIVSTYFSYKFKIQDVEFTENLKIVLQVESQLSIIDLYNSYVDILQRAAVNGYELRNNVIDEIASFNKKTNDFRICNLLIYLSKVDSVHCDESVAKIIESYTCGEFNYVEKSLTEYLTNNPNDYQMWIMLIKTCIYMGKKPEIDYDIIQDLFSLYSIDGECLSSQVKLQGVLKKYSDISWRYKLLNTINRKLKHIENVDKYIAISLLNEHHITPSFVKMLPDYEIHKKIMQELVSIMPNTTSLFNNHKLEHNSIDITLFRSYLFSADDLCEKGEYNQAEGLLTKIKSLEIYNRSYVKEKVIRRLFSIYDKTNQIDRAVSLIVNSYFEDENLIKRCSLVQLIERIKCSSNRDIYRVIDYPIFVYISNKLDIKEQRIAFSNYLDANGVVTKEELLKLVAVNDERYIFFMEKICTLNVIKRHVRLAKGSAVATAIRITILQELIKLNPKGKKEYLSEISSITTKREINNRVRQVTQHKIKVDVDKIKEEKREIFEENFEKYLEIKSFDFELAGYDVNDSLNIDSIKKIVFSMNEQIRQSKQYSQTILALKDFISDVEYEFLRNEKYGLDNYLSSRIRHGYCKAQLTKELREHHLLLSTADDDSEQYDVSQYWDAKVSNEQEKDYQLIKRALSEFTHDIECKIKEIRREWIRIRINKNEVGMFDFTSFLGAMLVIDRDNIIDFDMMFNTLVNSLWDVTETNLCIIRKRIQDELKPFFYKKLNELEQSIKLQENTSVGDISQEILSSITKCRARIATVMTEFENFFYRDDVVYDDFCLQELATTCIGIERQIHADFDNINLKTNIVGNEKIVGSTFSDFVEIIILLMNNAITHAGFDDMHILDLVLNFSLGGKTKEAMDVQKTLIQSGKGWPVDKLLLLSVENNLAAEKDITQIRDRVQYIFDNAKDVQTLKKYSISEGGSGIYKIYKTINYNVRVPYVILYSIEDSFKLFLAVNASDLIV